MCVLYYNMSVMKIFCEVFTDQNYLPKNLVKAVSVTIFGLFLGKLSQKKSCSHDNDDDSIVREFWLKTFNDKSSPTFNLSKGHCPRKFSEARKL